MSTNVPLQQEQAQRNIQIPDVAGIIKARTGVSPGRLMDLFLFGVLLSLVLLYQFQLLTEWTPRVFRLREVLYVYLYVRIILFYRARINYNLLFIFAFLSYCLLVAVHTYFLHGSGLALQGFMRFTNVALLAPLAAVLFTSLKQVKIFMGIWLAVYVLGAASGVYQMLGGELEWLVQDYLAIRAGLVRYKTLLGEPNVGGMAAVVVYGYTLFSVRSWLGKALLFAAVLVLFLLSLSKAAVGGLVLATLIVLAFEYRALFTRSFLKKILVIGLIALLAVSFVVGRSPEIRGNLINYTRAIFTTFAPFAESQGIDNDIVSDLTYRVFGTAMTGMELAREQSEFYLLNVLMGSSFGLAGSAAQDLLGDKVTILPHNSFLEIYLVGGIFMLLIFLALLLLTLCKLLHFSSFDPYFKGLFVGLVMIAGYMISYSNLYEPVTGAFFWLVVGIAANSKLNRAITDPR